MDESTTPRDKAFLLKPICTKFSHRRAVKSLDAGPTKTSRVKRLPWALLRLFGRFLGAERKSKSIVTPERLNWLNMSRRPMWARPFIRFCARDKPKAL